MTGSDRNCSSANAKRLFALVLALTLTLAFPLTFALLTAALLAAGAALLVLLTLLATAALLTALAAALLLLAVLAATLLILIGHFCHPSADPLLRGGNLINGVARREVPRTEPDRAWNRQIARIL